MITYSSPCSRSGPHIRSRLHRPKQAPSTWQIFFTEFLQNYKSGNPEHKLNISQAAKEGGVAYKALIPAQKEIYKRKARLAGEEYEREFAAWQRRLTPENIRQENAFRSAQRRAGKSRRPNLRDLMRRRNRSPHILCFYSGFEQTRPVCKMFLEMRLKRLVKGF
ncbi:hypothetical protein OPQ81_008421 [Rhizoctonia solani]|nr:hypothetical protein OPQ81_008421 [Rhizoctonia solani]